MDVINFHRGKWNAYRLFTCCFTDRMLDRPGMTAGGKFTIYGYKGPPSLQMTIRCHYFESSEIALLTQRAQKSGDISLENSTESKLWYGGLFHSKRIL